jgi:hypothetical protein
MCNVQARNFEPIKPVRLLYIHMFQQWKPRAVSIPAHTTNSLGDLEVLAYVHAYLCTEYLDLDG